MAEITSLREAIATQVRDGQTIAIEGMTHLIPNAAAHEIIRQGRKNLTLVRMTPDVTYDQLIGVGAADKLVFSWGGNPGVGSLHRLREAVEKGYPHKLEIEEHSHAGMTQRYVAGASGLPFGVLRGYTGTDLLKHTKNIGWVTCPFTGEQLSAVPALNPEVGIIHAQQADRHGNIGYWGIQGIQKECVMASKASIVTVEEIVDEFDPRVNVVIPSWVVSSIAVVPQGTHPSYAHGYSVRDNDFYLAWEGISRDRETFDAWIKRHILDTQDFAEHLSLVHEEQGVRA